MWSGVCLVTISSDDTVAMTGAHSGAVLKISELHQNVNGLIASFMKKFTSQKPIELKMT